MATLTDALMATSTAPYLSARALDDTRLSSLSLLVSRAVVDLARAGMLPCDDPDTLPPPSDEQSDLLEDICRVPWVDSTDPSSRPEATARSQAGWLRAYLLALSAEHEYRWGGRPNCASVLDTIPRLASWRVPDRPLGRSPSDWTDLLVGEWLRDADRDEVPRWTRRGPPDWLAAEVWRSRRAIIRDTVGDR